MKQEETGQNISQDFVDLKKSVKRGLSDGHSTIHSNYDIKGSVGGCSETEQSPIDLKNKNASNNDLKGFVADCSETEQTDEIGVKKNLEEKQPISDKNNNLKNGKNSKVKFEPAKTESISWKCEQFFGKNWKYVAAFIGLVMLVNAYQISNIGSRMAKLEQTVSENNAKVVLTTTDGRAIRVMKEPLKAEYLKQYIASALVNHLIVDRKRITNDFNKVAFKDETEALKVVQSLTIFYDNYLDTSDKNALGYLRSYINWLINAVARDELPEVMLLRNYNIEKYVYENNSFEIQINASILAQSFLISENKYINHKNIMQLGAKGHFDLSKATDGNPYGLRITELKFIPVKKVKGRY